MTRPEQPDSRAPDHWLDSYLPYLLYRVSVRMNARLQRRLIQAGINLSQWRILSVLRSYGNQSIGGIVQHTLMEQPTVSRVVTSMHAEGYLARWPSTTDSRVVEVSITEKGIAAFELISHAATKHQEAAMRGFGAHQIRSLRSMLEQIEANILEDQ